MTSLTVSRRAFIGSMGAGLAFGARTAMAAPVTLDAIKKAGVLRI